jgi:hypothetical protein
MGLDKHEEHGELSDGFKRYRSKPRGRAEFQVTDTFLFMGVVSAVLDYGGAIRFGRSRDGGVLAIGIYGDGEASYTVYCHSGDEMVSLLNVVLDNFRAAEVKLNNARKVLSQRQG